MATVAAFGTLVVASLTPAFAVDFGIYYETRCPASQQWINQQLRDVAPFAEEFLLSNVSLHPVPHGNAKETLTETGHYQYQCQNGPEECYLNRVEACGLSVMKEAQVDVWAPWIDCVNKSYLDIANLLSAEEHISRAVAASQLALSEAQRAAAAAQTAVKAAADGEIGEASRDAAAAAILAARAAADASLSSMEVTRAAAAAVAGGENSWVMCPIGIPNARMLLLEILVCSFSPLGEKLQHIMAEETPPHEYVPWVTVDKQHSTLAEKDLRCAICMSPAGQEQSMGDFCKGMAGCEGAAVFSVQQRNSPAMDRSPDSGLYLNPADDEV